MHPLWLLWKSLSRLFPALCVMAEGSRGHGAGGAAESMESGSEELPSQLDLGSDEERVDAPGEAAATLAPSYALSEALGEVLEEEQAAPPLVAGPGSSMQPDAPGQDGSASRAVASAKRQAGILGRKGRPSRDLQAALRQAMEEAGQLAEPQLAPASQAGPRRRPVEQATKEQAAALRSLRSDLVKAAGVKREALASLVRPPVAGFSPLSPAAPAVVAAARLGAFEGERLDAEVLVVGKTMLGPTPVAISSKRMRAATFGVPEQKLTNIEIMLSSAAVLLDRSGRAAVEKLMAHRLEERCCLMYVDAVAYDETPLPVALKGEFMVSYGDSTTSGTATAAEPQQQALAIHSVGQGSFLGHKLATTQGPQKLLSMVQVGGMLLEIGGKLVTLLPKTLNSLGLLPNGTAEALVAAIMGASAVSRAAQRFQQRTRAICSDRAATNVAAERLLANERGEQWRSLHLFCSSHKVATAHEMVFCLVDGHIRGMIHCVLALHNSSAMSAFREALREEVASRFRLRQGVVSEGALAYKRWVLKLFVSHGQQLPMRRVLLAMCPNGDWRSREIEYVLQPGQEWTREQALQHITSGLLAALCAAQPKLYRRARWTGADASTDSLGILEACHCLLSTTFFRFLAGYQKGAGVQQMLATAAATASTGQAAAEPVGPSSLATVSAAIGVGQPGMPPDFGSTGPPQEAADPRLAAEADWAAINASHRRQGAEWVSSRPLGLLMAQRQILEPLRQLMSRQFLVAAEDWECEQRYKIAAKLSEGEVVEHHDRSYRLAVAGLGTDERVFFTQLSQLFEQDEFWEYIPMVDHTVQFRALIFRLASAAGCAVEELLAFPNRQFPMRLFGLLAAPQDAPDLAATPSCMLDAWSAEMHRLHPEFAGAIFQQKLAMVSQILWKDISQLESRHATIRRLVTSGSVQTHVTSLRDLSAQWSMLQFRKRSQKLSLNRKATSRGVHKVLRHGRAVGSDGGLRHNMWSEQDLVG